MENLKAVVYGRETSRYQRALAIQEFEKYLTTDRFNLNHKVIIYPNERGWKRILELISHKYQFSDKETIKWVNARKTNCGGYEEQLWVLISELHGMFYNGQMFMAKTEIILKHE